MKRWKVRVTKYVNDIRRTEVDIFAKNKKEALKILEREYDKRSMDVCMKFYKDDDVIDFWEDKRKDTEFTIHEFVEVGSIDPNHVVIFGRIIKD